MTSTILFLTGRNLIHKNINVKIYHQIPLETSKIKTSKDDVILSNAIVNGLNATNNHCLKHARIRVFTDPYSCIFYAVNDVNITARADFHNNQGIIHLVRAQNFPKN